MLFYSDLELGIAVLWPFTDSTNTIYLYQLGLYIKVMTGSCGGGLWGFIWQAWCKESMGNATFLIRHCNYYPDTWRKYNSYLVHNLSAPHSYHLVTVGSCKTVYCLNNVLHCGNHITNLCNNKWKGSLPCLLNVFKIAVSHRRISGISEWSCSILGPGGLTAVNVHCVNKTL